MPEDIEFINREFSGELDKMGAHIVNPDLKDPKDKVGNKAKTLRELFHTRDSNDNSPVETVVEKK